MKSGKKSINAKLLTVWTDESAKKQRRSPSLLSRRHMWRKPGRNINPRETQS